MATIVKPSELSSFALFVPFILVLIALIATHASVGSDIAAGVAFLGIPVLIIAARKFH